MSQPPTPPGYGAPAPGGAYPPPGLPTAPPAKKKSPVRLIVTLVIALIVIVVGIVGYVASRDDAQNAKVGDCLTGQTESTIKIVDCSGPHEWTVVGEIKDQYESDFSGDQCHDQFPDAEAAFWWGKAGEKGDTLCLAPAS